MKLTIIRIDDRGIQGKERLLLKVTADANLTRFVIIATTYESPDEISGTVRAALWLPGKAVKAGDFVRIYTGRGQPFESRNKVGSITHRIFWGLPTTLWGEPDACAVLAELRDWGTSPYLRK